ncbi:MAG: ribosome-associated translation inhibitor RaiA [bacterium]|nr:ribosome-associated translation inhibitor RaiA [bacterium]
MQVNISWRHFEPSKVLEDLINKKLAKLEKFSKRVLKVETVLAREGARNLAEIQIKLSKAPTLLVKEQDYDMYKAINSCMDKAKRKIKQYESKVREKKK